MSLVMIPAGIALFAFGVALSATGYLGEDPVSGALKGLGAMLFALAAMAELGPHEALMMCLGSRQGPGDVPLYRRAITSAS